MRLQPYRDIRVLKVYALKMYMKLSHDDGVTIDEDSIYCQSRKILWTNT